MRHARAIALCNIGTALVETDRPRDALPHYETARTLSEEEGFRDTLALVLAGQAMVRLALRFQMKLEGVEQYVLRTFGPDPEEPKVSDANPTLLTASDATPVGGECRVARGGRGVG